MPAHCNCEDCDLGINLRNWINSHPFPSYEKMCARIDEYIDDFRVAMVVGAEYGEFNHAALKKIYESQMNDEVCIKAGADIYARGGLQALKSNYIIFRDCTPLADASPSVAKQSAVLQFYWDGIEEFRKFRA